MNNSVNVTNGTSDKPKDIPVNWLWISYKQKINNESCPRQMVIDVITDAWKIVLLDVEGDENRKYQAGLRDIPGHFAIVVSVANFEFLYYLRYIVAFKKFEG